MVTPLNVSGWNKKYDHTSRPNCMQSDYVTGIRRALNEMHEKIRQINRRDKNEHVDQPFAIGEKVYVKILPPMKPTINQARYVGPYEVKEIKGRWCYVLKNCETGKMIERNYYHIKRYVGRDSNGRSGRPDTSIWSATVQKKDSRMEQELKQEVDKNPPTRPCRRRRQPIRYGIDL